ADGAGLSAVQIGVLKRVFVIIDEDDEIVEFVNPEILETSGSCPILEEGCLSVPKYYGKVKRPNIVVVKAFDRNGKEFKKQFVGFSAKVVCHESDHLDGILFIDKTIDDIQKVR
ncbi:MAG: peptide deformylase, partial [Clostridia bacterium]|nr:peptide deformylase [Clostridia bacterium]